MSSDGQWRTWPKEPWIRGSSFTEGSGPILILRGVSKDKVGDAGRRAVACVNALAGVRNVAAVKEALSAAKGLVHLACPEEPDVPLFDELEIALAALDQELEEG